MFGDADIGGATDYLYDGELPRSFTARARVNISGGQFVTYSGAANVIGSTIEGFIPGSMIVDILHDSDTCVGIALHNAGSNKPVAVATRGTYICTCGGDETSGGQHIIPGSGTIQYVLGETVNTGDKAAYSGTHIGRALTSADSGTTHYCLVSLNI